MTPEQLSYNKWLSELIAPKKVNNEAREEIYEQAN